MIGLLSKLISKNNSKLKFEKSPKEFIPYACHYAPDTLLTKNGELFKVIKIPSFSIEKEGDGDVDIRENIRKTIIENIDSQNFSVWIHTIRSKQNILHKLPFKEGLSKGVNNAYIDDKYWDKFYVNDLYITIIRNGKHINFKSLNCLLNSLMFKNLKKDHEKFLEQANHDLNSVVNNIFNKLKKYGANILTIEKRADGVFSQPLTFLKKLTSLSDQKMDLPMHDLSKILADQKIAFGFNSFEVKSGNSTKYGTIFGLKEYIDLPIRVLNRFLNSPMEFIISQSITFISYKRGSEEYKKQIDFLNVSEDESLKEILGFDKIEDLKEESSPIAFCESQISITIYGDDIEFLERENSIAYEILSSIGYVVARQDLRLEEYYWATLPANFKFINRRKILPTNLTCGFAISDESPTGQRYRNVWGENLTIFNRIDNIPYFFNYHYGFNGNTAILSTNKAKKNLFTNFLMLQARKYNGKLFYISPNKNMLQILHNLIGGDYINIAKSENNNGPKFNPLSLEDSKTNRKFLQIWFETIFTHFNVAINDEDKLIINQLIDYNFTLPFELRHLNNVCQNFNNDKFEHLKKYLNGFHGNGEFSWLFDNNDFFPIIKNNYLFDVSYLMTNKIAVDTLMSFLIQQITNRLDGSPSMIIIDEAWDLLNNNITNQLVKEWSDAAIENNAVMIFTASNFSKNDTLHNFIKDDLATLVIADNKNIDDYKTMFNLSASEVKLLTRIIMERNNFIVRQKNSTVINNFNLRDLRYLKILEGEDIVLKNIQEIKANNSASGAIELEQQLLKKLIKYVQ